MPLGLQHIQGRSVIVKFHKSKALTLAVAGLDEGVHNCSKTPEIVAQALSSHVIRQLAHKESHGKQMISSVVRGTVIVSLLVGISLYVISRYSKTQPNTFQKILNAAEAPSVHTLQAFTDSTGVTWTLGVDNDGKFYYTYTPVSSQPILLWDSVNRRNCANWTAMIATNPVSEYTILAVTPNYIAENGTLVVFSLILAAGDVRISSTLDTRYWSIANMSTLPFLWPSTIPNGNTLLWQSTSPSNNTLVQFTSNGQLAVIALNAANAVRWTASDATVGICI